MRTILDDFCHGKKLTITGSVNGIARRAHLADAYMVYNPKLINGFIAGRDILKDRFTTDALTFRRQSFLLEQGSMYSVCYVLLISSGNLKQWVIHTYHGRVNECLWNRDIDVCLSPGNV